MKIKDPKTGQWVEYPDQQIKKLAPDPELSLYYELPSDELHHLTPTPKQVLTEEVHIPQKLQISDLFLNKKEMKRRPA